MDQRSQKKSNKLPPVNRPEPYVTENEVDKAMTISHNNVSSADMKLYDDTKQANISQIEPVTPDDVNAK
jgi:hypothetical protein